MGATQAPVSWPCRGPVIQEPTRDFAIPATNAEGQDPSEERLKTLIPGTELVPVDRGGAGIRMLDLTDPVTHGMITVLEGRAAANVPAAAMLSAALFTRSRLPIERRE